MIDERLIKEFCKTLFNKLTEPLTCGAIDCDEVRYQVSKGERSIERIFILSDQLFRDNSQIHYRSYFDGKGSWKIAIKRFISSDRACLHPQLLHCLTKDMITSRKLDLFLK